MLEVFDATRCAQLIVLSLSFYCSDNGSKGELWIGASTRANLGERESRIHRGCEQWELSLKNAGPPPAGTRVRKGKEGGDVCQKLYFVAINRKIRGRLCCDLYMLMYLPLVS